MIILIENLQRSIDWLEKYTFSRFIVGDINDYNDYIDENEFILHVKGGERIENFDKFIEEDLLTENAYDVLITKENNLRYSLLDRTVIRENRLFKKGYQHKKNNPLVDINLHTFNRLRLDDSIPLCYTLNKDIPKTFLDDSHWVGAICKCYNLFNVGRKKEAIELSIRTHKEWNRYETYNCLMHQCLVFESNKHKIEYPCIL